MEQKKNDNADNNVENAAGTVCDKNVTSTSAPNEVSDVGSAEKNDNSTTSVDEKKMEEPKSEKQEIIAIPFMLDLDNRVELFYASRFTSDEKMNSIDKAYHYFENCFANADKPRWDGVLICVFDVEQNKILENEERRLIYSEDFKRMWLMRMPNATENVTFNVKCTMLRAWANQFQSFLKSLEKCGNASQMSQIAFMADGKGSFHPKFEFSRDFEKVDGIDKNRIADKADLLFDIG